MRHFLDILKIKNTKHDKNYIKWKWSFMDNKKQIKPYYTPKDENDKTLIFESRFESGNLALAAKVSDVEYKLVLQNDCLTKGNTQCILPFF